MTVAPISVRADHVRGRPASRRAHPAWIQALPHYDPDYDYQWEHYIYESDFTTDPGYLVENVKTPQGEAQEQFEDNKQLVAAFVHYRNLFVGQSCRVIGDRLIRHLDQWLTTTYGAQPEWEQLPERVSPDIALWVTSMPLPLADSYSAAEVGLPRLVMECVSRHSRRDPDGNYEEWSTKYMLYAWLGIPEYWIYDPTQEPVRFQGYRLVKPGIYQAIPAVMDPPGAIPSTILDTALTVTADHTLQLWDMKQGTWFNPDTIIHAQGYAVGLAQGRAERLVQERLTGFLRALPDTGLPLPLQADLAAYIERIRGHAMSLPLDIIPDAGTLWQTLYRYGGPDQVPAAVLWALMPPLPNDPAA